MATCGGCSSACDDSCGKPGRWTRFKGRFSKHGCDNGCDNGCGTSTGAGTKPEVIPAPKKEMPKGGVTGYSIQPTLTPVANPKPIIEIGGPANPF